MTIFGACWNLYWQATGSAQNPAARVGMTGRSSMGSSSWRARAANGRRSRVNSDPRARSIERFQEWVASGALERAWAVVFDEYDKTIGLNWNWLAADGCLIKASFGTKGDPAKSRPPAETPPTEESQARNGTS